MTSLEPSGVAVARAQPSGITVYGCEPDEADLFQLQARRHGVAVTTTPAAWSAASDVPLPRSRCVSVTHRAEVTVQDLRRLRDVGVDYVSTRSIGVDHIDVGAAADLGITVGNVVYPPDGVADFTVMLILMAVRRAVELVDPAAGLQLAAGRLRGGDLCDLTVGVVGVGRIGSAVIRRLHGFGCRLLACGNDPTTAAGAEPVDLDHLLRESDVITLHLPLTSETHHLIGPTQLASVRPGAILVNTARGALVDTDALVAALESGRLGGAALDVVEGEELILPDGSTPCPVTDHRLSRLRRLPNVAITPHVAYRTGRTLRETVERTVANCMAFERSSGR